MSNGDRTILKGGRVVDPINGVDGSADVLIDGGRVTRVGPDLGVEPGTVVVEVPRGCVVCPGFIDMHVHLRSRATSTRKRWRPVSPPRWPAALPAVACMPNTEPVNDDAGITRLILARAAKAGLARVYPIGAVTKGQAGEQLAEIGELRAAGCVAVSDDGRPVANASLMRRALEYAAMFDMPVIDHCEDLSLAGDGVAHEGHHAAVLGLRGLPAAAEAIVVERDVILSGLTGSPVHIAHISARGALGAVRAAKDRGVRVSCEVTPHHLTLTDEQLVGYGTNYKMNPPLREGADVEAMLEGLCDGSIDCIATDHAPHHYDEKLVEFDRAPFGIVGLETAVSICLDRLVHAGLIPLRRLVELLAVNPARILGVPGGNLSAGAPADITVLAPELAVRVDAATFRSLARNTPFAGWSLRGGVAATMVGGRAVYVNEAVSGASAFASVLSQRLAS